MKMGKDGKGWDGVGWNFLFDWGVGHWAGGPLLMSPVHMLDEACDG